MKTSRGTVPLKEILVSRYHAAGQQRAGHPGAQADSQAVHQVTMTLPQQQK